MVSTDLDYRSFLENLDKPPEMLPSAQKQREQAEALRKEDDSKENPPGPIITPLMECIINKRLSKVSKRNQKAKISVLQKDDSKVWHLMKHCVFSDFNIKFLPLHVLIDSRVDG